ncbi:MAG TPA: hypothetical protein PLB55_15785, partial [Prosthecobacter sp.]|nr:hypothetical protein [Prosthecobacter sp.]
RPWPASATHGRNPPENGLPPWIRGSPPAVAVGRSRSRFEPPDRSLRAPGRLWLVRDTRHGEKPKDLQRRLKRFRQQRPGGL